MCSKPPAVLTEHYLLKNRDVQPGVKLAAQPSRRPEPWGHRVFLNPNLNPNLTLFRNLELMIKIKIRIKNSPTGR